MRKGKQWTREELFLVMNLYCRIPFGKQHSRAAEVIDLAQALGRTPGSVAMKLNNISSLDPAELLRGIKGLPGASKADREIWNAFHSDWESCSAESQRLWDELFSQDSQQPFSVESSENREQIPQTPLENAHEPFTGPTENVATVKIRRAQGFFRRAVLAAYETKCCITENPVPELLVASHILPWSQSVEHRANPHNGLCLSRLHDAAFDRGLITIDEQYRVVLSPTLRAYFPNHTLQENFAAYEGKIICLPQKFMPHDHFLEKHRENVFVG